MSRGGDGALIFDFLVDSRLLNFVSFGVGKVQIGKKTRLTEQINCVT